MALPRGFRLYLPLGEVGIAFSQFRMGQNKKFLETDPALTGRAGILEAEP